MNRLDAFPRVLLGHWPTPIERLNHLEDVLGGGPELYIKRDDCSGLGLGGNKVRKLEFLCADALAKGANTLITVGALQSNHARQTAAAAAKLGLNCHLVLPNLVKRPGSLYEQSGNPLLDQLFGATVHVTDSSEAAGEIVVDLMQSLEGAYFIPSGGTTDVGCLGFASAAEELVAQEALLGAPFNRIVLAASTGGTLAGLLAGLEMSQSRPTIDAIMVFESVAAFAPRLDETLAGVQALLQLGDTSVMGRANLVDGYLGEGYGVPTAEMTEAVRLLATCEGVLLDPVYTGKAMAALIDRVRQGAYSADERILFWHTGGTPALFAYGDMFFQKTGPA